MLSGIIRGGLLSAADPLGPERTPPDSERTLAESAQNSAKAESAKSARSPAEVRRTSATFGGLRAGPSGPEAEWRKCPPVGPWRTVRRGQMSASPPSSGLIGGLWRTFFGPTRTFVRGGLLCDWRTFMGLADSSGLLYFGGHIGQGFGMG